MLKQIEIYLRDKRSHKTPEWSNNGVPFLIGTGVHCDASGPVKVKGEIFSPVIGERYRLWGEWQDEPEKYGGGQCFRFYSYEVLINNTIDGISDYLEKYVDELGPVRSREIVNHFGASNCLKILRETPERVSEIPGIGPKIAGQIKRHFTEETCAVDPVAYASIYNLLADFSPPKKVVQDILYDFKSSALEVIRANPYLLLNYSGLGWKKVDEIARKKLKYDPKGIERGKAAILEALQRISTDGDTYAEMGSLEVRMSRDLNVKLDRKAIDQLSLEGAILVRKLTDPKGRKREYVCISSIFQNEQEIAWRLKGLIDAWQDPKIPIDTEGLEDEQIEACKFLESHGVCLLVGPPGTGKAQPLDSKIVTENGIKLMGDIGSGDTVIGSNGKPCKVTGVFPQGKKQVVKLTFGDDSTVECCLEHLWKVKDRNDRKWKIVSTSTIIENMTSTDNRDRWQIPMVEPVEFSCSQDRKIDPYIMGIFLGNGCFRGGQIKVTTSDNFIQEYIQSLGNSGLRVHKAKGSDIDFSISSDNWNNNWFTDYFRSLGLFGLLSIEKFIPDCYKTAPVKDRIAILQGLLDTEGFTDGYSIEFTTSSEKLAEDFTFLVQSLGGKVTVKRRIPKYTYKGEKRDGKESFRFIVMLPNTINPFRTPRKSEKYIPKTKYQPIRKIVSFEYIGEKECQCISVDSSDSLYVTDNFIVTHNTFTVTKVIQTLYDHGHEIMVVTPTGKAAKRASEVLGQWIPGNEIQVSTIHRALEPSLFSSPVGVPDEHAKFNRGRERFHFIRNESEPLTADVVIVDETSMVDVELFVQLLRAIPPGCRLIMSGDEHQLPSVGPGACLRDMIAAGIPSFSLTKPRRNSGRLVLACHAIKDGKTPEPSPEFSLPLENWLHIEEADPHKIASIIVQLHDHTDRDPMWDLQVISPQNDDLPIACANLNKLLSKKLNPARHRFETDANVSQEAKYGPGDKIVRTKNGFVTLLEEYDEDFDEFYKEFSDEQKTIYWNNKTYYLSKTYVVNGDIGIVIALEKIDGKRYAIVRFKSPDRLCLLPVSETYIALAYAITVHKAQGSGFNIAIVPLYDFHWNERNKSGLWTRELVYTMLSRGIDGVITVGKISSLGSAIRNKTVHRRQTFLASLIQKELSSATPES